MIGPTAPDGALDLTAIELGAGGLGAREIAASLKMSLASMEALAAADPAFAAALAQADEAARAWWESLPRIALSSGIRFNHAAWREVMRHRFGVETQARASAKPQRPRATYILPDNGRGPPRPGQPVRDQDDPASMASWRRYQKRDLAEQYIRAGLTPPADDPEWDDPECDEDDED